MKKIFLLLMIFLAMASTCFAEIVTRNDYRNGKVITSQRSAPYNEQFIINSVFRGYYNTLTDRNGVKTITKDPCIYLEISLKRISAEMPEEIQFTSDKFSYLVSGDPFPRAGNFTEQYDGMKLFKGTGRYSVYGDNESGYEVLEHHDKWYKSPSFVIEHPRSMSILNKKLTESFCKDLFKSIITGTEMVIQVPYVNNKYDIKEQKYITFGISKETLAEWKEVAGF